MSNIGASGGEWHEYQRLVLAELERLNKAFEESRRDRAEITRNVDRVERNVQELTRRMDRMDDDQNPVSTVARLNKLEDSGVSEGAVKKYKLWLGGLIIALIGSIILPVLALIITTT